MCEGRGRAAGVITVFFSLLAAGFLALFFALAESARVQGARAQSANNVQMGLCSVFAEYERGLLDYEIFGLNGAYGTGDFAIGRVEDRLRGGCALNASPGSAGLPSLCFDPWHLRLDEASITSYALLSDRGAEPFYQQVVSYMKETAVTGILSRLLQYYKDAGDAAEHAEDYQQAEQAQKTQEAEAKQQEEAQQEPDGTGQEASQRENPLQALIRLKRRGLMNLVCPDQSISEKSVSGTQLCFHRWGRQQGNLTLPGTGGSLTDDLLFREYLLGHLGRFPATSQAGLDYQVEYVLGGKRSDAANLKAVVRKLLWLREGCNYLYSTGSELAGQAETMATALVGWTGIPELIPVTKHGLLLGISYGQSLVDVRILLAGGRVPLYPNAQSWRVSFSDLPRLGEILDAAGEEKGEGLSYPDYLRLLLYLQGISAQKKRGLEMVELGVCGKEGQSNFRADHCVVGVKVRTAWSVQPVFDRVAGVFTGLGGGPYDLEVEAGYAYG